MLSAEESSRRLTDELETQERKVNMIEAEKVDLMEALATRWVFDSVIMYILISSSYQGY